MLKMPQAEPFPNNADDVFSEAETLPLPLIVCHFIDLSMAAI